MKTSAQSPVPTLDTRKSDKYPLSYFLLDFLNVLLVDALSLVKIELTLKFAYALALTDYNVICVCETGLNKNNELFELLLDNCNLLCRMVAKKQKKHPWLHSFSNEKFKPE